MRKILESCPTCGSGMEIRELHCHTCGTEIRGHYDPCPFCRLTDEQTGFLEMFVQAKGNMRLLEQTLGLSYPTVRNRVEAIALVLRQHGSSSGGERDEAPGGHDTRPPARYVAEAAPGRGTAPGAHIRRKRPRAAG